MFAEPVEVIRAMIDAFERRDASLTTADSPFHSKLASVDGVVYRGYTAAAQYMADIDAIFDDWRVEDIRCFAGADDTALALYRVRATGRASGAPVDTELAMVWTVVDGLGTHGEVFVDIAAAMERVGVTLEAVRAQR